MMHQFLGPRKRRTRQHIIADLGVHHLEQFVLDEGHTVLRMSSDYGYDLALFTYDEDGYAEPGSALFQVKATESLRAVGDVYVYDLDLRDYNLWWREQMPVILILFDALRRHAVWLPIQRYFGERSDRQPKKGAKRVRVRIPIDMVVSREAIKAIRKLIREALR